MLILRLLSFFDDYQTGLVTFFNRAYIKMKPHNAGPRLTCIKAYDRFSWKLDVTGADGLFGGYVFGNTAVRRLELYLKESLNT
jgi:hypothetical protein